MSRWAGRLISKTPVTPGGSAPTASAPGVWTLPEMAYWKKQGLWPDASADAYWGYVSYLMGTSSLSNGNNNLFVDSSGAFNPVARNGNATQGTVSPYGTLWSNYFNGSSYITMSSGTAAGSGDFTIEGWFNVSSYGAAPMLYDARPGSTNGAYPAVFVDASGYLVYYVNTAVQIQGATAVGVNTWNHFALCRSGTSTRLFLNGVQQGSTYSDTNNYLMGASRPILGGNGYVPGGASQLTGYLSNIRVVNGTALYTAAFTPPAAPLTAISGTVLLTCQSNRFRDASSYNASVSLSGSVVVTPYSPFVLNSPGATYNQSDISYWSGYFNGSSYLSAPDSSGYALNSSGWSFETFVNFSALPSSGGAASLAAQWYDGDLGWWFYLYNNAGTYQLYFSYSTNGSSQTNISVNLSAAPQLNTWNHIAYLYLSGIGVGIFWNGVQIGTFQSFGGTVFNSSSAMQIGARVGSAGAGYYLNGYLSNMRLVNAPGGSYVWPPTAPITAISGTTLLTLQSAAFTDNSTTNAVFTPVGSPTVTGNNPFQSGYYSNYFDGNGDALSISGYSSTAIAFGTSDFTIEFWVNPTTLPNNNWTPFFTMGNNGGGQEIRISQNVNGTGFGWLYPNNTNNGDVYAGYGAMTTNTWHHVAMTRSGSTMRLFLDGAVVATATGVGFNFTNTTILRIGLPQPAYPDGAYTGYLSNFRLVKGTAVYTAAFTPPTAPLAAISGTGLLTCQANRLIDSSANAFALTKVGDTAVAAFNPFYSTTVTSNGGSLYFDGSGDWLSAPNSVANFASGNFTAECWIYFNSNSVGYQPILANAGSADQQGWALILETNNTLNLYTSNGSSWTWNINSSYVPAAKAWLHIAIVRNGSTLTMYANGVSLGTSNISTNAIASPSGAFYAGYYPYFPGGARSLNGYMADIRLTPGTAVYTAAFTPPAAPLSPTNNTTLLLSGMNGGVYDAAMQNVMETSGGAQVSKAQAKYGATSVFFNGSTDWLSMPNSPAHNFGTGDFTIESWVYQVSTPGNQNFVSNYNSPSEGWGIRVVSGVPYFMWGDTVIVNSPSAISVNTWTHVAVTRSGTTVRMFVGGTQVATATDSTNFTGTGTLFVGRLRTATNGFFWNGYLDDLRITKGVARYTANFTPPTAALPVY